MTHETSSKLLLAMPELDDGFFRKSVILLVEDDENGAMGFAVNIQTGKHLGDVVSQALPDSLLNVNPPILLGGPVKTDFLWVMHAPDHEYSSTIKISRSVSLTAGQEIIPAMLKGSASSVFAVGVGYSGWSEGQLEREINQGSWWKMDSFTLDLFGVEKSSLWDKAIEELGIDLKSYYDTPTHGLAN